MENITNDNTRHRGPGKGKAAITVAFAVAIVIAASFIPWSKLTNGVVKDYDLFADIKADTTSLYEDTLELENQEKHQELLASTNVGVTSNSSKPATNNTSENDCEQQATVVEEILPQPSKVGDLVVIENYTGLETPLSNIKSKLAAGELVRIAVLGDSYIEGDIITQDLRSKLQSHYGGSGVGFVNMHSEFPGFRRSVTQGGNGWKSYTASKRGKAENMGLSEQYSTSQGNATATYKGTSKIANANTWNNSRLLVRAPQGGSVQTRVGKDEWQTHSLESSERAQTIHILGETSSFEVKITNPSIAALGVWLDNDTGISVDCMSSRGVSGYTLAKISTDLCESMRESVDYDLIVLEYGINVMNAKQSDYSVFTRNMTGVINHLRHCYPNAQFLLLGVGDRGEKRSGAYHSMSTINKMIAAQRKAAMQAEAMFWDTREAMGGEDAIVSWAKNGNANKDYIHLTHKGGAILAESLFKALSREIDK